MRIRDPKTTALVFSTGKVVLTGAKSEYAAKKAAMIFLKAIKKVMESDLPPGSPSSLHLSEFTVQNVCASCDVRFIIKLEAL